MIFGHEKSVNLLSKIAESGAVPHAILFTGPDSVGKKKVAIKFAKWLFHGEGRFNEFYKSACSCKSCSQIDGSSHPDFCLLEESPIQIRQIRDLKGRFSLAPFYTSRKIAIIDNVESMRQEAANALLKLLEEPKGSAFLILAAKSRSSVLPTIASRALEIRFTAKGRWYKEFLNKKDVLDKVNFFEKAFLADKFLESQKYSLKNKIELIELLDAWLIKLRERLLSANDVGKEYSLMKHILYAKQLISTTNTNPQLIMEELCVTYFL